MRIDDQVLAVLSAAQTKANALTLTSQLDRALYAKTNKVLEALGGKWNRKAAAHLFEGDAADLVDAVILTGEVTIPKDFDYFPTPPAVVEQLIGLADLRKGMTALEPSAGEGAIALALRNAGCEVACIEMIEKRAAVLSGLDFITLDEDFLKVPPAGREYDRIVMNPPFSKQADVRHVQHACNFLKPGGLLVAVMSAGVMFRENKLTKDFRDRVELRSGRFVRLPEGAFKSSGTLVNSVIAVVPG